MYEIFFTPSFDRAFRKLDKDTQRRIKEKLFYLAANPNLAKRLSYSPQSLPGLCKYRIGNWRILFWIDNTEKVITLYLINHRDNIYKNL